MSAYRVTDGAAVLDGGARRAARRARVRVTVRVSNPAVVLASARRRRGVDAVAVLAERLRDRSSTTAVRTATPLPAPTGPVRLPGFVGMLSGPTDLSERAKEIVRGKDAPAA